MLLRLMCFSLPCAVKRHRQAHIVCALLGWHTQQQQQLGRTEHGPWTLSLLLLFTDNVCCAACGMCAADTSSSRPPHDNSTAAEQEGQGAAADFAAAPWGFPALAVPAVEEPSTSGAAAAAGAEGAAAAAEGSSSSPKGPEEIILVAPVSPGESPFLAGAALASCSKNSSPAGKALSRGGSRAHSSSSAAGRAAAAGNSSSSSSRRLSAAGRQQQQQQQQVLATSSGGARSPLGDGAVQGPAASGPSASSHLLQQGSAGYDALGNALIPGLDADAESTGELQQGAGCSSRPASSPVHVFLAASYKYTHPCTSTWSLLAPPAK